MLHFGSLKSSSSSNIQTLLELPNHDTHGEEEEETGKEDGEEDEQVDTCLILTKEDITIARVSYSTHYNVQACTPEIIDALWNGEYKSVAEVVDNEKMMGLFNLNICGQSYSTFLNHSK